MESIQGPPGNCRNPIRAGAGLWSLLVAQRPSALLGSAYLIKLAFMLTHQSAVPGQAVRVATCWRWQHTGCTLRTETVKPRWLGSTDCPKRFYSCYLNRTWRSLEKVVSKLLFQALKVSNFPAFTVPYMYGRLSQFAEWLHKTKQYTGCAWNTVTSLIGEIQELWPNPATIVKWA